MVRQTAAEFDRRYGSMVRRRYGGYRSARILKNALAARRPSIQVSDGVLKQWIKRYARPSLAVGVADAVQRHRYALGAFVSAQEETEGSTLRSGVPPSILAGRPAWAAAVRKRLSILSEARYMIQQEMDVLLDQLHSVAGETAVCFRKRPRWRTGALKAYSSPGVFIN